MNGYQFNNIIALMFVCLGVPFGLIVGFNLNGNQDLLIIWIAFTISIVTSMLALTWKKITIYEAYLKKLELDQ